MSSSRAASRRGGRRGESSSPSSPGGLIERVRQRMMLNNQRRRSRSSRSAAARGQRRSTSRDSSGKTTPMTPRPRSATRSRSRSGGRQRSDDDDDEEHGNHRRSSQRRSPFDESVKRARHVDNNNNGTNRGRSRRRGRSRSWFNNKSSSATKKKEDDTTSHRPPRCGTLLVSPPGTVPSPRLDVWVVFAASSCACLVSIANIHDTNSRSSDFNGWDWLALTTCCLSFVIGLAMALGMRVGPSRMWFTQPLGRERRRQQLAGGGRGVHDRRSCVADLTLELLLLSFLLFLWMFSISTLVDGTNTGGGGDDYDIIWNDNLFYSSWTTFLLCTYLWVEVLTSTDRGGVITIAKTQEERLPSNTFTKRWTLLLFVSLVIFSASIATYTGPMCRGSILKSTRYCSRSMSGILIGGLFQCLMVLCVAILYRLSHMRRRNRTARNARDEARDEQFIASTRIRDRGSCTIALTSLMAQCIHVALVTSPTGGGPGNDSGTLYFGSWLGFVSSFELCLRYLEFYTTVTTTNTAIDDVNNDIPKRVEVDRREGSSSDDVTVYEESKSEGDSPLGNAFEDQTYSVNDLMHSPSFIFSGGTIDTNPLKIEGRKNKWPRPERVIAVGRDPVATPEVPIKQSVQLKNSTRKVKHNRKDSPGRSSTQQRTDGRQRKDGRPAFTTNKSFLPDPIPANNDKHMLPSKPPRPALPTSISARTFDRMDTNGSNYDTGDTDDMSNCFFFDDMILNSSRPTKDPITDINIQKSTSIHVEVLDDVQPQKLQRLLSHMSFQRSGSSQYGLSPLVEKDSPETDTEEGISPPLAPSISSHQTGGDIQKHHWAQRSKASPTVSLNISGKNPDLGRATPKQSNFSNKEQGADDSDSVILTVDDGESGSNPNTNSPSTKSLDKPIITRKVPPPPPPFRRSPTDLNADSEPYYCVPVQSIHTSTGDTDSIISEPTLDAGLANDVPKPGPRSTDSTRRSTDSTYKKKLSDDTNDKNSDDTQYEKKLSDDTLVYNSSDDNADSLRPHAGRSKQVVDSIVAAALAYAEKSLSACGSHDHTRDSSSASVRLALSGAETSRSFKSQGSKSRGSFNSRSLRSRTPPPPVWKPSPGVSLRAFPLEQSQQLPPPQQQQRTQRREFSDSSNDDPSSSIHSLFSTSESLLDRARNSNSNLQFTASSSTQPAVNIEGSTSNIPAPIARQNHHFSASLSLLTKESVGSMYSNFDDTETKNDDEEDVTGGEYDC